jgi:phage baseplate assembly protein W
MARSPANIDRTEKLRLQQQGQTPPVQGSPINSPVPIIENVQRPGQRNYVYSDVNVQSEPGQADRVYDRDAVRQSLMMILGTTKRTRWWRPQYGADLERLLFEPLDTTTAVRIQANITQAILDPRNGDSRMDLRAVDVLPDTENNRFFVAVIVDVPSLDLFNEEITFGLQRLAA